VDVYSDVTQFMNERFSNVILYTLIEFNILSVPKSDRCNNIDEGEL